MRINIGMRDYGEERGRLRKAEGIYPVKLITFLMNRKVAVVWVSFAMVLSLIVIIIEIAQVVEAPTTWYVDDVLGSGGPGDPPEDFTSIQDAMDASNDGDTIFVYNGTYYGSIEVNKTVNLIGEDMNDTIIDGNGTWVILYITADWVNISDFTVINGDIGLRIYGSSNNTIKNNTISFNNDCGIILLGSSNNNIINNDIFNNSIGIGIYGRHTYSNNITFNKIVKNGVGISICDPSIPSPGGGNSSYHFISNNIICDNFKGIDLTTFDAGVIFGVKISSSNIFNNEFGIYLMSLGGEISGTTIYNCTIEDNRIGIYMFQNRGENSIVDNNISYNKEYAISLNQSRNNYIHNNNFISNGNGMQVYDNTELNFWNDIYPSGGNFWSDYHGDDIYSGLNQDIPGSDGIGDTNYSIDSDSVDNYPLMLPIGPFIFLNKGWNLISLPYIQTKTNLELILSSINGSYDAVQWYNISDHSNPWKHNHISKPHNLNDFQEINHTIGFWIHIIEPGGVLFEYSGTQPTQNQTIPLNPGWNMVGYPSLTSYNRTEGLNNLTFDNQVDAIWSYDASTQKWEEMGESDYFIIGRGYYIHAKSECEWEVPL